MGVNTDGEETCPGSKVTDGVELTEKTNEFVHQHEIEQSLPQDADCDVGIQGQKLADGPRIPLNSSLQHIRSQQTLSVLNTEYNETQDEHRDGGKCVQSNTPASLRPDAGIEDRRPELSHDTPVFHVTNTSADDKYVQSEECSSPLQPAEIVDMLIETDRNDPWDAMINRILNEIKPSDANAKLELPFNPDIDQMDEEGYTHLYKAALEGHLEDVDDLISRRANPNKPSKGGLRPLHAAAQEGHTHIVDFLILQGADVHVECDLGQTPLYTAASSGYTCIVQSLIVEGADVNKKDNTGRTAFNTAVKEGKLEAVRFLLTKGAKQNRYSGKTPLSLAAMYGHLDIIQFFISKGTDVNEEDNEGIIPLHGAAVQGNIEIMEYLIQQGSDVNKGDVKGWTPFNVSIRYGHLEAVKYLITEGAKQNRYDGMTPLYAAARFGHKDIVKFFVSKGGYVNEENDEGMIPLHGAALKGNIEIMEYLIQQGSDVNKEDVKGWTPFNAAVQYGNLEAIKYLTTKGAKQNRYDGMTPLFAAAQSGHLDIVKLFISNGADVNEEDEKGMIPLHGAASGGHLKVMEYLIENGTDVNKVDAKGSTLFNAAAQKGHQDIVDYLTLNGADINAKDIDGLKPLQAAVNEGHPHAKEGIPSCRGDSNEEEIGDPRSGGNQNLTTKGYVTVSLEDADTQSRTGRLASQVDNAEDRNDCSPADNAKRGTVELSLKTLSTRTHDVEKYVGLPNVKEHLPLRTGDPNEEDTGNPLSAFHHCGATYVITSGNVNKKVVKMKEADTHSRTGQLPSHVDNAEDGNDYTPADNAKRGADELSLKNLPTRTHDDENDEGRPNVNNHLSARRGDQNEEDKGDSLSRDHHYGAEHLDTGGNVRKKKVVKMKEADTHTRTGQLASHVDNTRADNAKRGADELSSKNFPTRTHDDENAGNGKHNPFSHAKLKCPYKGEQDPMLNQMEAIKSPLKTNGTDCPSPCGPQTWQYSGFDPPILQTMEADGHLYEDPESSCHTLTDENRQLRESSTPMDAENNIQINGTSTELESFPTHSSAVDHHRLSDENPVSDQGTSSNPVPNFGTNRRTTVYRCPSIVALVHTFLPMITAFAIILAGSPVLVAGRDITEQVTLQAGKPGMVPFLFSRPPSDTFTGALYYTLRFESNPRPFSINGEVDIEGFKKPSQEPRFSTSVTDLDTSPCMNLFIDDVETLDEDGYVLTSIWHSFEESRYEIMKKEIVVQIPPGQAKCFIVLSENVDYRYEVHCQATTGSVATTLSCYQNDRKVDIMGDITDNGKVIRGIFLIPDHIYFSCCSHDATLNVSETICNDFEWSSGMRGKEPTTQDVNNVPTFVTNNISRPANEHTEITPTPQIESHIESGACRQFLFHSMWHFTYLFVYIVAFHTM